ARAVPVQELDRVLDREDVLVARLVDVVEQRRERRRLAGAGGARDEDETARSYSCVGMFSSSRLRIRAGMSRNAAARLSRWKYALTRKRASPGTLCAK